MSSEKAEILERLAAGIAHDLNNIITGIVGFAELALAEVSSDDPCHTHLTRIKEQGLRAAGIMRQLVAFSGRQMQDCRNLDLDRVISQAAGDLREALGDGIELTIVPSPGLHAICADAEQMKQLLIDLGTHARTAMPQGGRLVIETGNVVFDDEYCRVNPGAQPGDCVRLSVTDTGSGMTSEVRRRAFEPYFNTEGKGKGSGLALAAVHGIVRQHRGLIHVESEPGRGTIFKIYFKAAAPSATNH